MDTCVLWSGRVPFIVKFNTKNFTTWECLYLFLAIHIVLKQSRISLFESMIFLYCLISLLAWFLYSFHYGCCFNTEITTNFICQRWHLYLIQRACPIYCQISHNELEYLWEFVIIFGSRDGYTFLHLRRLSLLRDKSGMWQTDHFNYRDNTNIFLF